MKTNMMIYIEKEVREKIKKLAAQNNTSASALIASMFEDSKNK